LLRRVVFTGIVCLSARIRAINQRGEFFTRRRDYCLLPRSGERQRPEPSSRSIAQQISRRLSSWFEPKTRWTETLDANDTFRSSLADERYAFFIVAPVKKSGIAFLGGAGRIAATGKKRIADLRATADGLDVKVLFAANEASVILQGFSETPG
jgi:hypothetical protein